MNTEEFKENCQHIADIISDFPGECWVRYDSPQEEAIFHDKKGVLCYLCSVDDELTDYEMLVQAHGGLFRMSGLYRSSNTYKAGCCAGYALIKWHGEGHGSLSSVNQSMAKSKTIFEEQWKEYMAKRKLSPKETK